MKPVLLFLLCMCPAILYGIERHTDLIVSKDGTGDFTTINEALNSLPMYNYERYVIFVKNGLYEEKILIDRDYITLLGESKDSTILQFSILRSDWLAMPDYIGAAVVNITADDVIIQNMTIRNTQPQIGPHAFAIYGTGTRTMLIDCNITSNGGDTVSLWNYKHGMYYHAGCYFEGGVDFVCPRGWCYIRDSRFYENSKTAALWHAAVTSPDQKMVLRNCIFDGVQGYNLGRHHYEAQFYLLDCTFSETMADKPIYWYHYPTEPEKNRPYFYGNRYFYNNCHRTGGDYAWHKDNPDEWPQGITPSTLTAKRTFDGKWDPETTSSPAMKSCTLTDQGLLISFNELLCIRKKPVLITSTGIRLTYAEGRGRDILRFMPEKPIDDIKKIFPLKVIDGSIIGNLATVNERAIIELPSPAL